jgi:hypothetical protein
MLHNRDFVMIQVIFFAVLVAVFTAGTAVLQWVNGCAGCTGGIAWPTCLVLPATCAGFSSATLWYRSGLFPKEANPLNAAAGLFSFIAVVLTLGTTSILAVASPRAHEAATYLPWAADLFGLLLTVLVPLQAHQLYRRDRASASAVPSHSDTIAGNLGPRPLPPQPPVAVTSRSSQSSPPAPPPAGNPVP